MKSGNCLLFIIMNLVDSSFQAPNIKRPLNKYRSPDSTPVHYNTHFTQKPSTLCESSSKLDSNQSKSAKKQRENQDKLQDTDHLKYQPKIPAQTTQIQELKRALEAYDVNHIQKDGAITQRISNVHAENQLLLELIKRRELEIQSKAQQKNNQLSKAIARRNKEAQQVEIILNQSQQRLCFLKSQNAKYRELHIVDKENQSLRSDVFRIEKEIKQYKSCWMTQEDHIMLKRQMNELHVTEVSLIQQNKTLKNELAEQQKLAYASSEGIYNLKTATEELNRVFCEILTIRDLMNYYQNSEPADVINRQTPSEEPLPALLNRIKSQVCVMKNKLSDVYAEQCGKTCINQ